MRRVWIIALGVVAAVAATPGESQESALATAQRGFVVQYASGEGERYSAQWTAVLRWRRTEDGGPAVPLQGKFIDDRRCRWEISGAITRRLYLVNRRGDLFENKDGAVVFGESFKGQGASFVLATLRPETCVEANSRYEGDMREATARLKARFPDVVARDVPEVVKLMEAWPSVKRVSIEGQ